MNPDDRPISIDLAREAGFALGAVEVRPSTRELIAGGRPEILEPRVMQVLIALARRRGQVVSRDDLITACWGGRAVSEDAIQRCIAALRRVAETQGGFSVTTVTRVGYRLDPSEPTAAKPASPLLAVLAFDDLSGDADMAYFADGVSEEILQTLAGVAGVKVIGRGSSFQFRGADKAAARIATALNATHILDGSVRRSGTQVRITTHLIDCASETTLWSDRFDRDLSNIFVVQDEIAAAVAAGLKVVFAPKQPSQTVDPAAYDLYLRAREMEFARSDAETTAVAVALLEQATALAPTFARAWAMLATLRAAQLRYSAHGQPYAAMRAKIVEAVEAALERDPGLGHPYQTLARLEPFGHYAEREALHRKALSVAPNDPLVLTSAGFFSAEVGRVHEALGYGKQAFDLDPMQIGTTYTYVSLLSFAGRHEESFALMDRLRAAWPDSEMVVFAAIAGAAQLADWARFDTLMKTSPVELTQSERFRGIRWLARNLRDPDPQSLARGLERRREELDRTGTIPLDWLTTLHRLGLTDQTFELIDRASFAYMFDPEQSWASGRTTGGVIFDLSANAGMIRDPRFVRLCAKLGLCDYWLQTERWPDCAGFVPYDFKAECRRLAV
jgi:TolB-like protein